MNKISLLSVLFCMLILMQCSSSKNADEHNSQSIDEEIPKNTDEQNSESIDEEIPKNTDEQNSESNGDDIQTASGLKYKIVQRGDGQKAEYGKTVHTHIILTLEDGTQVWTTRGAGGRIFPYTLGVDSVVEGFEEAISYMRVGDRFIFTLPGELGYGAAGKPPVPPHATLIFDIEVINITDPGP